MDRSTTTIVYDLLLDQKNQRITEMRVTVRTKNRPKEGGPQTAVVFKTNYRFDREGAVERFEVPADAAKFLK